MKLRLKAAHGFSPVEVVLVLVIVGLIGLSGYLFWQVKHKQSDTKTATATTQNKKAAEAKKPALKTYTSQEFGFSFEYPSGWQLDESLSDIGRGGKEGTISVTSPKGTSVYFNPNKGGKGGDCVNDDGTRTTERCSTRTIYTAEKLSDDEGYGEVYYYQASIEPSDISGGQTKYFITIMSGNQNEEDIPVNPGSSIGAFLQPYDEIRLGLNGYLTIDVKGKDDASNTSKEFFDTNETKEAAPVLKSFKFML